MGFALAASLLALALPARAESTSSSRAGAQARSAAVSSVDYELALDVDARSPEFSGDATLHFTLAAAVADLAVDFDGGEIASATLNGRHLDARYDGRALTLDGSDLRVGENVLRVVYRHPYETAALGLRRFRDPADGRVYLYSMFEPNGAARMMPCFDQPDLKGTFALTARTPAGWRTSSAGPESGVAVSGARQIVSFAPSVPLSPYVFSFHAGEYEVWESTAGAIPLRLFARRSLVGAVDPDAWLEAARLALDEYARRFDTPYPFRKYDQLLVPAADFGGMENAGAATFSDALFAGASVDSARREAAIRHEAAHMWFGDLATPRWWNDSWLSESLATYAAAGDAAAGGWAGLSRQKGLAYAFDDRDDSRPLRADVLDARRALANFDFPAYLKGAYALRQLERRLGTGPLRDGVRRYLKARARKSADAGDFLEALRAASGADLREWGRSWLETPGANAVTAEYACGADGRVSAFALRQSSPDGRAPLRRHETRVALYGGGARGPLALEREVAATYEGERTELRALVGAPCPGLVDVDAEDDDYASPELDARSLATAQAGVDRLPDPGRRAALWDALWGAVRAARLSADAYVRAARRSLDRETDADVLRFALARIDGDGYSLRTALDYRPRADDRALEAFLWRGALRSGRADLRAIRLDAFVRVARTPRALATLRALLDGTAVPPGLTLDAPLRWEALARLGAADAPDLEVRLASELARDPAGGPFAAAARAARPSVAAKREALALVVDSPAETPLDVVLPVLRALFPRGQEALRARFAADFYRALPGVSAARGDDFTRAFVAGAGPFSCSASGAADLEKFLAARAADLSPAALRSLSAARQEGARCARARAQR